MVSLLSWRLQARLPRRGRGGACEGSAEMSSGHWPSVRGNPDTGEPRNLTQVLSRVSPELSITTDYL